MGGGKGGSTTSKVEIPAWLEAAAQENLARGRAVSEIGYTPYYGPDVAAMTPLQMGAIQGTSAAANAFGLGGGNLTGMEGMPQVQRFSDGTLGYSSGGLYDQAVQELQMRRPGQYDAMTGMFIDPYTGASPRVTFGSSVDPMVAAPGLPGGVNPLLGTGGGSGRAGEMAADAGGRGGGYTGLRDMVNGGGPGASGSTFSGGGRISDIANASGIGPLGSRR
jgi:hypothetical protein